MTKASAKKVEAVCPFDAAEGKVIIRHLKEETTPGGLVLPDSAPRGTHVGEVVAVGEGPMLDSGIRVEIKYKPGDHVLFDEQHGNTLFEWKREKYFALAWRSIYAKLK